jgi:hypothetical protein
MPSESRNSSLLGNGSVKIFPRKRMPATIEQRCFLRSAPLISAAVNQHSTIGEAVFNGGTAPRLYNGDLTQLVEELRELR